MEEVGLKPGTRLTSAVCSTEVIVVRPPAAPVDLRCGGEPMSPLGSQSERTGTVSTAHASGTQLGKRYADEKSGLELLCTKAGDGSLSLGQEPLVLRDAKPLPSSD